MFPVRSRFSRYSVLLTGAAVIALSGFSVEPAAAQDTDATAIEEIVVTARKREESLYEVPMAVSVFQGDSLEEGRIENSTDLIGLVPSLSMTRDGLSPGKDFAFFVMRGVGANSRSNPAVPVFVDGVYQPRLGFDMDFVGVERVEVLHGPQGTIFGRNTEGGAINIVTRRPDAETRVKIALGYDEFNTFSGQASFSGALSENAFASVVIEAVTTDGYLNNSSLGGIDADGGDDIRARAALRFTPSEELEIFATFDISSFKGLNGLPGVPRGCGCYDVGAEFQEEASDKNHGGAVHIEWATAWAVITSVTGYRNMKTKLPFDFDGGGDRTGNRHDFETDQKFFSEELRFASNDASSPLQWLGGVYYFDEKLDSRRRYDLQDIDLWGGIVIDAQDVLLDRSGYAFFGQGSYALSERLELTAGLRYSSEKVTGDLDIDFIIFDLFPGFDFPFAATVTGSEVKFNSLTWLASLSYDLSDSMMVYLTASTGARSGGFPIAPADNFSFQPFKEESTLNLEGGLKGTTSDGRFGFELAGYYIELKDQQLASVFDVDLGGGVVVPIATTTNAGKSHVSGFEATLTARPTDKLTLTGGIGYVDSTIDDYVDTGGIQHEGEAFPFTPKWTINFGAEYVTPVGGEFELALSVRYRYVDNYHQGFGVAFDPIFQIDSYNILDLSAALSRGPWTLQVYADNVANNYIETRVWNPFFLLPDGARAFSNVLPPRRFGAKATYSF